MTLQAIFDDCGLDIKSYHSLQGGDINQAFALSTFDNKYFLKINDAERYPDMFEKEARGLAALQRNSSLITPQVIKTGVVNTQQYLLLEWLEAGNASKNFWNDFGADLANMHRVEQPCFGWEDDNYIGNLRQANTQFDNWETFYSTCRIMPLVKVLFDAHVFTQKDSESGLSLCKKMGNLFPKEPASLLHGDLWSGNYMIAAEGKAALFDPAVYYGHREMDIGMTLLFGGFDPQLYSSYHNTYPLETGWQQRLALTQLYPLLVHAVLFGGHYIGKCRDIINRFN